MTQIIGAGFCRNKKDENPVYSEMHAIGCVGVSKTMKLRSWKMKRTKQLKSKKELKIKKNDSHDEADFKKYHKVTVASV